MDQTKPLPFHERYAKDEDFRKRVDARQAASDQRKSTASIKKALAMVQEGRKHY